MKFHKTIVFFSFIVTMSSAAQYGMLTGTVGTNATSTTTFDQLNSNLGYKAVNPGERFRVDGTPYLFDDWNQPAIITTKRGDKLKFDNVNFDARRNKIVAKIEGDTIYTFNSLALAEVELRGKKFKNIITPNNGPIKVFEVIAELDEFTILKDYRADISEGSINPMRGTIYSKYIHRDDYIVLKDDNFEKISLKKKTVLKLLADKKSEVMDYVNQKDLNYKDEKDLNDILNFYSEL